MSISAKDLPVELNLMRIVAQGLIPATAASTPVQVVGRMLATQGQITSNVPHSLISRTLASLGSDVTRAFESGQLVRSWPFRGTLHITTAEDYRWLRALDGDNSWFRRAAAEIGLEDRHIMHAREVARDALADGPQTRAGMRKSWLANGVGSHLSEEERARLIYILFVQFHGDGTFVSGPLRGNEHLIVDTYSLPEDPRGWAERLDDGDPEAKRIAFAEIARRYAITHGPVTDQDLARWTGAGLRVSRQALADALLNINQVDEFSDNHSVAQTPDPNAGRLADQVSGLGGAVSQNSTGKVSRNGEEGGRADQVPIAGMPDATLRLTTAHLEGKRLVPGSPSGMKTPTFYLRSDLWDLLDENREDASKTMYLAMFDELHVGYKDRSCLTDKVGEKLICPGGNGMFRPLIVDKGRLVAVNPKSIGLTWYKSPSKRLETDAARAMKKMASRLAV
ncbi:crosslink repair DNA glycosylase YcaQ family protein [Actinomycetaceae bacterium MB13-C1-2]|nr:crosslink repair DNA glycosylase YcaQ family protein [Actinomycetaceae bacterium MB13-C1-2]